jgi:hypothetical protein
VSLGMEAYEQLLDHWRMLLGQWYIIRDMWKDPVRDEFEKQFWQEYEQVIPGMLHEMQELDHVLEQARRNVA